MKEKSLKGEELIFYNYKKIRSNPIKIWGSGNSERNKTH